MKILFLHISDMHIKNKDGINGFQIKKIADSINQLGAFEQILLIISGDIAYSGHRIQYEHAWHAIGQLITAINKSSSKKYHIHVLCVPGNHDIDQGNDALTSSQLQKILKENQYGRYYQNELCKQHAFYNFAERNHCFKNNSAFYRSILKFDDFVIEANLINSAIFSSLEEDKGLHYLPQACINELSAPTGADFVITVMHHAVDWFIDSQKNQLEETVYKKSSVVFYGHEHYIGNKSISYGSNQPAIVQAGGCLCTNDNWDSSSFHASILDTNTYRYTHMEYCWNSSQQQYEGSKCFDEQIAKKPSIEKHLQISKLYMAELCNDAKHEITQDFRDYYIFPRIQTELLASGGSREFTNEDSFIEEVIRRKKVLISGGYNCGKSTLLKKLFLRLYNEDYAILFCSVDSIRGKKIERIIKNCFEDIYGNNSSDYVRYEQIPKEKKVLIIDDIDQVKQSSFDAFLSKIDDKFEFFIFTSNRLLDLNLFERMKEQLKAADSIYRYQIMPFYADKRLELIQRIVTLKTTDKSSISKTVHALSDTLTAQRRFISLDPDFIIKYVECYCNKIGDIPGGDSGIFSKVFETSLVNAIGKVQLQSLSVDKVFVLLAKTAHYIHFNKIYPISEQQIMKIVETYNCDYGSNVRGTDFITIVSQAKILIPDNHTPGYKFSNKNYLAYFVAKEINSQYNNTGNDEDIQTVLHCACFGINSDILLFISYITDNIKILRLILQIANDCTNEWPEFDFVDNMPQFLKEKRNHYVALPAANTLQIEKNAEVQAEKECDQRDDEQTADIYCYSDDEADNFVNQLVRAAQLLIIVARCLPNFEHNMLKADKDSFIQTIYCLPNKIFALWATEADKEVERLMRFFKEQSQDYYSRQKEPSDSDILRALQWSSMSLLLDMYNLSVYYSAKDNTISYLSDFDYKQKSSYKLEHLMMSEKQALPKAFAAEALSLDRESVGDLFDILVKRVVSHALVFRSDFENALTQQLQDKFFPNKDTQKKIRIQRIQNKRIETE